MFGIVRFVFWISLYFIILFLLNKFKFSRMKQTTIVIGIIIILLWTLSCFCPIENFLITFSSPEGAFNYVNSERVIMVVQGENTDLVIGEDNNSKFIYLAVPKDNDGWKIGRSLDTKLRLTRMHKGIFLNLYQYKNTDDYYMLISNASGNDLNIKDSLDSQFLYYKSSNNETSESSITYYASVQKINKEYCINIDGEEIALFIK